ncbi:MAG: ribonuclease Y [Myxococcales bacterium]|nr:ribonuclease Y [Myxococcales bacterium]
MSPILLVLLGLVAGALAGAGLSRVLFRKTSHAPGPEGDAGRLVEAAQAEAEVIKKQAQLAARELTQKLRTEAEEDARRRRSELTQKEQALGSREEQAEKKAKDAARRDEDAVRREKGLATREQTTEAMAKKADEASAKARAKLEEVAAMTAEQARQALTAEVTGEARAAAASELKRIESTTREESTERAQRIIAAAIQRHASEYVGERTVSVIPLPSDDLKGRLIGREGRNVRALEAATGIDLIIDDTPETITISCFNPLRREIARLAIGRLLADGRIHPTRIEEVVKKAEQEVGELCREAGEQAVFDLGLHRVHPELVAILGGMKFRSSNAQNLLAHSVEVGFLAGALAGELGQNVKQARRAGLFHDLGKAVDHREEGPHALVGAELARRHGEAPAVCQAIAAHHEDTPAATVLDHVVDAANRISGQRPGARREALEAYAKRLTDLEELAKTFAGVERVYAIQMGRELRVIVDNAQVTDDQAAMLSRDLAKKIEKEMTYPGQVRVCVLRETRATDYAR